MKNTAFTDKHVALGAKMTEFAGYNMPVVYTSINEEHQAVRRNAGVFDVSHMGEFLLEGPYALDLLQRLTSNDASRLVPGKAQYSCFPNKAGGIVDDLLVYCLKDREAYMVVVNAANIEKDWNWIAGYNDSSENGGRAEVRNISDQTSLLAIQGPNALRILQPLTEVDLAGLKYYTFSTGVFAGVSNVMISATGYTGAGGVEIYFENKGNDAEIIWDAIFREGAPGGLRPVGLGARDTLRLEMGYCLYGNDIDDHTTPLEAGLGWITKFNKEFTAKEILQNQKTEGVRQKLVGFEMTERGIPRHGYLITDKEGGSIGRVTSGTQSPSLGKGIGLGYVQTEYASPGTGIFIRIRDKNIAAQVSKVPFE